MDLIFLIFRLLLFGIFVTAATGKTLDLAGTRKAMEEFGLGRAAGPAAIFVPAGELIIGLALLFPATSWYAAVGCILLLAAFSAGIVRQILRGSTADCHCFGQIHSEPPGAKSLIRNALFALPAAALVYAGPDFQGLPIGRDGSTTAYGVAIAILVVGFIVSAAYLKKFSDKFEALQRRIEFLETVAGGGETIMQREESGNPTDALPIGAEFPDFALPDTRGRIVTFEHLLADFRPKLFVFVGPTCEPCKALIPAFVEWKKSFGERIRLVFVSSGTPEANIDRFGADLADGMLLQKERELSRLLYAKWTPTAIFVNREGKIASHNAVGDVAIRDLADRLMAAEVSEPDFYIANGSQPTRLKIGQKVPEFEIKALDGRQIDQEYFRGRRTLAVFLSTTCSHCLSVADQLRRIENSTSARPEVEFVVFTDGEPEAAKGFGLESPVIIEKDFATAIKLGMFGAPSAVLVNEEGIIETETAVGGPAIWSLLGRYDIK